MRFARFKSTFGSIVLLLLCALIAPLSINARHQAHQVSGAPELNLPDPAFNAAQPLPHKQENQARHGEAAATVTGVGEIDVSALLRDAQRNGTAMHRQFLDYTYTLRKTRRTLDERGKSDEQEVQEFEAYPVRGEHVLIQLNSNGIKLPPWRIDFDRRRAGEHLMEAERKSRERAESPANDADDGYAAAGIFGRTRQGKRAFVAIDPTAFLHASDFSTPHIEKLNYRDTIVLEFRVRPGSSLPPSRAFISKFVGQIWIDVEDKVITRLEAWPAPEFARKESAPSRPVQQARVVYQQAKLPTGIWVPSLIRMNANGDESIFDGLNWDVEFEFRDYKRFTTTSEDAQINPSTKQP